jgi:hypothetical protein
MLAVGRRDRLAPSGTVVGDEFDVVAQATVIVSQVTEFPRLQQP